jgi:hypothetical protein
VQQLGKLEGFDELDSLVAKRFRDPQVLALAHENRMSLTDVQRLRTIVDLAVRLGETTRRPTPMLQTQPHPLKS